MIDENDLKSTYASMHKLFKEAIPTKEALPLDPEDVARRVAQANQELVQQGTRASDLLDSVMAVFEQQRYYDATRLYMYAEKAYEGICKNISNAAVSGRIKQGLVDFSEIGFPRTIEIDNPPLNIMAAIFNKETFLLVEITIEYVNGLKRKFMTEVQI